VLLTADAGVVGVVDGEELRVPVIDIEEDEPLEEKDPKVLEEGL
jgi:hypothetical protein